MRLIFTSLLILFFCSGCKSTENLISSYKESLKSPEQKTNESIDQWISSKDLEILKEFNYSMPFSIGNSIKYIKEDDLITFYKRIDSMKEDFIIKSKNYENDMPKLLELYRSIDSVIYSFNVTRNFIDSVVEKHANEFENYKSDNNIGFYDLFNYCDANNIESKDCMERNGIKEILFSNLISENNNYDQYIKNLNREIFSLKEVIRDIAIKGKNHEKKIFLTNAKLNGCEKAKDLNFRENNSLSDLIGFDYFKPNDQLIYELKGFKISQSLSNGLLLSSTSMRNYSTPFIFVDLSGLYADDYVFDKDEEYVCYSGIKEYKSILGVIKRVNSFHAIKDDNKYYFLK
ncbi:hypothetical protein [Marinomonas primoryensis]|uniref:Uncharacterized protein n=1 Tax=Marinomonas primoryensis TaxID=178399 RepID=A0A859CTW5_9GAMM|nr:hypothetical protein [Marinomonas primoryensis]QKK79765.1 uncharacterized protein MP3633_1030 [Marinomonas primoryensis]QKK80262.1 uncharacterized protein MP3633_1529 [Marinomonas primoryensis]